MIRHLTLAAMLISAPVTAQEDSDLTETDLNEIDCLARNIYFEARNQSVLGQLAVAEVVLNRVKSKRFPNTICEVVYQGGEKRRHRCQFSWYCDGKSDRTYNLDEWKEIYDFTVDIYRDRDRIIDITNGAIFYHADYVKPYWAAQVTYTITIDNHLFYGAP